MAGWRVLGTGRMLDYGVVDVDGKPVGRVEDVVLDPEGGRVAYVVLSVDDSATIGDRLYAVPWSALRVSRDGRSLVLDATRERFRKAPAFPRDRWPDMSDRAWAEGVYRFYDRDPYWDRPANPSEQAARLGTADYVYRRHTVAGSAGSAGLLAAVILLLLALGIVFYALYPRQAQVAAESMGQAAEKAAIVVKETSEDIATVVRVKTALALSKAVSGLNIDVDAKDGVVTLQGEVPSESARRITVAIAQDTQGVLRVEDQLVVNPTMAMPTDRESAASRVADVELEVMVQEAMRNHPELKGQNIRVEAEKDVVTLSGSVSTSAQREEAERIARQIAGVREVVNRIQVAGPSL